MTLISFSRSHWQFETQILIGKSLCAHYLLNQWLEFYQTSTDTSLGQGKEVIRFWWPWPHFQGHYIIKTKNELCMHSISWFNRWNLTKLAQLHHWDGGMKWIDCGILVIFSWTQIGRFGFSDRCNFFESSNSNTALSDKVHASKLR